MIHYLPLEHLESRYTGFLDGLIVSEMQRQGKDYLRFYPRDIAGSLPADGHFFHASENLMFRAAQLTEFAQAVGQGRVRQGDMVFLSDLLLPGLEFIGYLNYFNDLSLDIRGLLHAGSFSDADITRGFERWYSLYENLALDLASQVFLGSDFIRRDLLAKRLVEPSKLVVTGFELDPDLPLPSARRLPRVVFTGRISPDKQPWMFDQLAQEVRRPGYTPEFVKTVELRLPKRDYYALLAESKVVVSFALQETFGTGVREAVKLGCVPVVPNSQCYPEDFPAEYRYDTFEEAVHLVRRALDDDLPVPAIREYPESTARWFQW